MKNKKNKKKKIKKLLTFADFPFEFPPSTSIFDFYKQEYEEATSDSFKEITKARVSQKEFLLARHEFVKAFLKCYKQFNMKNC